MQQMCLPSVPTLTIQYLQGLRYPSQQVTSFSIELHSPESSFTKGLTPFQRGQTTGPGCKEAGKEEQSARLKYCSMLPCQPYGKICTFTYELQAHKHKY